MPFPKKLKSLFLTFNQTGNYAQYAKAFITKMANDKSCNARFSYTEDTNIIPESDIFYTKDYNQSQISYTNSKIFNNFDIITIWEY